MNSKQNNKESFARNSPIGHLLNASKMAFLPNTDHKSDEQTVKRKRNRKINSCKFCYRRHMKCNKEKPFCDVCIERDADTCEYYDENEKPSPTSPISKKRKNPKKSEVLKLVLGDRIALEDSGYSHITDLNILPNPLTANPTFTIKDERTLFFGPTCFRSSLYKVESDSGALHNVFKVWNVFKKEKDAMRKTLKFSLAQESKLLETGTNENLQFSNIINVIPKTKEEIKYYISLYFKSPLHDSITLLSEDSVMRYIDEVFLVDAATNTISEITYTNKRNYYKAGIVLYILGLTYFDTNYPDIVVSFFMFLQGHSTGKLMFIERVQFLTLKCLFSVLNGFTGGDFSHIINLIDTMCTSLVEFQLNKFNAVKIYENNIALQHVKTALSGDYTLLSNLFFTGLFLDVICAYQNGRPLFIGFDHYPNEWLLLEDVNQPTDMSKKQIHDKHHMIIMKKFLYYSRALISEIYKPTGLPKINKHVNNLIDFIHNDLNLNEMCYGDTIPSDEYMLQEKIFQSFIASFGTDLLLSVLSMRKDYKYDEQILEELSDTAANMLCNQILFYSLIVGQIDIYLTKCIHERQLLFEEKNKDLMLENNSKTLGCDKVLFYMSFSPRYCNTMRSFVEFFKVLLSIPLSDPLIEGTFEYMDELTKEEELYLKTIDSFVYSDSKEQNSDNLRQYVRDTNLKQEIIKKFNHTSSRNEYHLPKIYKKFHPDMIISINKDLSKFKFTSLQLYGWFVNLHNEQNTLDRKLKDQTEQFKLQVAHMQSKQKFARRSFSLFLSQIINEKTKRGKSLKSSLLKKSLNKSKPILKVPIDDSSTVNNQHTNSAFSKTSSSVNASPLVTPVGGASRSNSFCFMAKTPGLNSPISDFSQIQGGILNNTSASPFLGWDMNFIDFSSKMNWFLDPLLPQPSYNEAEINFMIQSPKPEESNNKEQKRVPDKK